jgi:hypothetical protein
MKDHPRSKPWVRTYQAKGRFKARQKAALNSGAEQGEPKGGKER